MSTLALVTLAAALAINAQTKPPSEPPRASAAVTSSGAAALANGRMAEAQGRLADAVRHYREASADGSGEAAKRLGDLYWRGGPGVDRDLAESLRWYREAEVRGQRLAQAVRLR